MSLQVNFDNRKIKITFLSVGISLFLLSLLAHQLEEFLVYRALRGLISCIGVAMLFYFQGKNAPRMLVFFLTLYGGSSFTTIWYEIQGFAITSMVLNTLAFLVLLRLLVSLVNFKKLDNFMSFVFLIMILGVGYLMYEFVHMIQSFSLGSLHYAFILLSAMVGVVLGFFALLYNHNNASRSSLSFTLFIFILLFAEVFRGIGYYDFAFGDMAVFIARILHIVGTFLLVKYSMLVASNK